MAQARVFISYASEDLAQVRRLYEDLKKRNVNAWFDDNDLRLGRWKPQITKAIAQSNYFLFCISEAALKKIGDKPGNHQLGTADVPNRSEIHGEAVAGPLLASTVPPRHDVVIDHCPHDRGVELRRNRRDRQ